MLSRLGNVLYWLGCAAAVGTIVIAAFTVISDAYFRSEPLIYIFPIVIALMFWLIGRACRYVLSGN
jgi:hypothetical protein